jgi:hypothetical protein
LNSSTLWWLSVVSKKIGGFFAETQTLHVVVR